MLLATSACGFRHGTLIDGATAGDDAPPPIDAPPCISTCADPATLHNCVTDQLESCPLGCHTSTAPETDRCSQPVPSNGATIADLDGVTGDLVITEDSLLDSTTGAIATNTGAVLRAAG